MTAKSAQPLAGLVESSLLFLGFSLFVFYGAHRWHKLSSNHLTNLSAIVGCVAAVLWAAQNVSKKIGKKLDSILLLFTPKSRLLGISSVVAMCFAILLIYLVFWQHLNLYSLPFSEKGFTIFLASCSAVSLATIVIFIVLFRRHLLEIMGLSGKRAAKFKAASYLLLAWPALAFLLCSAFGKIWPWPLVIAIGPGLRYLALTLVRIFVSPLTLSDNIRELAEGRSITLAFVFLLCCLALIFLVSGLLMAPTGGGAAPHS